MHKRGDRVADSLDDLEKQLDALLSDPNVAAATQKKPSRSLASGQVSSAQAGQSLGDSSGAASEMSAAKPSDESDPTGLELADQIQKLLDEAAAKATVQADGAPAKTAAPAAPPPSAESSIPTPSQAPAEPGAAPGESQQTIDQIDRMLCEKADQTASQEPELQGDFQSPEEARVSQTPAPQEQQAAAMSVEKELDQMLEGSFETAQEAAQTPTASPAMAQAKSDEPAAPASDAAARVAAELDADEKHPSPAAQTSDATAAAGAAAADAAPRGPSLLVRVLAAVNSPIAGLSPWMRDVVGFIGIQTLCVALVMIAAALAGMTGLFAALGVGGAALAGAFYALFIRRGGESASAG
jgi:hypothetical protein